MSLRLQILAAVLIFNFPGLAQQNSTILQGAWSASAGPEALHGKWTARITSRRPNVAGGAWILLNDSNDIVLQGTWSAQKSRTGWKGTFTARVLRGRTYSGSLTVSDPGTGSKTFIDMLQAATRTVTSGTWFSGRYGGAWRLSPAP